MLIRPVARAENAFPTKFGLPRQSGLCPGLKSVIRFEKEFSGPDWIRGIKEFSHLWLVWGFDEAPSGSATVRPPKLGQNERKGVFATRSPFRPNPLGLTLVKLESVNPDGSLTVSGGDMKSGTLIYDIKPYLPYADTAEDAVGGFGEELKGLRSAVVFPEELKAEFSAEEAETLTQALALDPRPGYQDDPGRVYGFGFAGRDVRFRAENGTIYVTEIV
ncbi:MAG: tRNA (N6-threonylcarbamoyladenosine(37)-N6)-methyltransferase TrmO [Clostridia bacterium]|nr:tRNA (N6-threonylcarbamoyladenosine(37)-N6)-methyltransferase TrmO [Clostridia bacterium]